MAVLLNLKEPLHQFVGKIGEGDLKAIMQFVVIALVILPILPDRAFGPYAVLNAFQIWWTVVLSSWALSLPGYVAFKLLGVNEGAVLTGMLGGVISITATAVTYSRRSKEDPKSSRLAALIVMIRLDGGLRPGAGGDRGSAP